MSTVFTYPFSGTFFGYRSRNPVFGLAIFGVFFQDNFESVSKYSFQEPPRSVSEEPEIELGTLWRWKFFFVNS